MSHGWAPTGRCRAARSRSSRSMRKGKPQIDVADVEAVVGDVSELALERVYVRGRLGRERHAPSPNAGARCRRARAPQAIIAATQRHFQRLHRVRAAMERGQTPRRGAAPNAAAAAFQAEGRLRGPVPDVDLGAARRSHAAHRRGGKGGPAVQSRSRRRSPSGSSWACRCWRELRPLRAGPANWSGCGLTCDCTDVQRAYYWPPALRSRGERGRKSMTATHYDVVAIGNAIVDIMGRCDDAFLDEARRASRAICAWSMPRPCRRPLQAMGPASRSPAGRQPTRWSGSPRSAGAPPSSARSPRTSSGASSATTSAPPA